MLFFLSIVPSLLAFVFPLAIYCLVLGTINRRRRPLLVYGPWDFAGVLLAASGFLICSGPGALSVLNDSFRQSLVYGNRSSGSPATESLWYLWLFLMVVYFVVIVAGSAFFLWRARHQTAIYNVEVPTVQAALSLIFERLSLRPLRSGDMYYFGMTNSGRTDPEAKKFDTQDGIQPSNPERITPQQLPLPLPMQLPAVLRNVILEVDAFPLMSHVTLRWEPADSGLRQEIERELDRELAETIAPATAGGWMTMMGCGLFVLMFLTVVFAIVLSVVNRLIF